MNILKTLEEIYADFVEQTKTRPTTYEANRWTLHLILNEMKMECHWLTKTNDQMIKEGLRYRGVLFSINNELEDEFIIIN